MVKATLEYNPCLHQESYKAHTYTQNAELLVIEAGGTYSYHWTSKH
jgi:hypothetical protein